MSAAFEQVANTITVRIADHANVIRGHDAVHPDRDQCGGVGGCALMRAEHDAEVEVTDALARAARMGLSIRAGAA